MNVLTRLKKISKKFPDNISITHHLIRGKSHSITFNELEDKSDQIATSLKKCGIMKGDFVGIYMQKSIEHVIAIIGILKAGAIFYSVNAKSKIPQVKYILNKSNTKILFVDNKTLLNLSDLEEIQNIKTQLIHYSIESMNLIQEKIYEKINSIKKITKVALLKEKKFQPPIVKKDVAFVLFTSGTTGEPKGVMISHQDLYNRATTECRDYNLNKDDCLLSLLPFSFDVGCNQLFSSLLTGSQLVIFNSWLPTDICSTIEKYNVTGISGVPTIWNSFIENQTDEIIKKLSSLKYLTISGGDLPPSQLKQLKKIASNVDIYKTYGQTETFRSGLLKPHEFINKMTSVGRAVEGTEIFILNKKGEKAKPNEIGEVIHRGDGMMIGYVGDIKETEKKIKINPIQNKSEFYSQKAVYTGDTGKIDEDGYLFLSGRKDKMIKTSGFRVYPKEITDQILSHKYVMDAVVFGIKNEKFESSIFCEIQLKEENNTSELEIKKYLSTKLPSYMIPSRLFFVESFPRTPSGKIKLSEVEKKYNE